MPPGILDKIGPLTDDDWKAITAHPWTGVLTLFHLREHNEYPYRAMMVSYEHHLKRDGGYPKRLRPRPVGFYSKIVAVIEAFDAATTRLGHNASPATPAGVVEKMREKAHEHLDPVVVLTFTDMLGAYPVGTVLMLDSYELAIAHSANPNPDFAKRPMVLVISDAEGNLHHPGVLADLGERGESGDFKRSILETVDPTPYGIRVGGLFPVKRGETGVVRGGGISGEGEVGEGEGARVGRPQLSPLAPPLPLATDSHPTGIPPALPPSIPPSNRCGSVISVSGDVATACQPVVVAPLITTVTPVDAR